ncbi:MAG TPA: hypothetical protein VFJ06_01255 [Halococcus sp.]|nr:hypothetical protein [Halococcus sp.]
MALTSSPAAADGFENEALGQFSPGDVPGQISLKGQAEIADVDRQLAQQRGPIERTINAVSELGVTPDQPINETLPDAVSDLSNVRVVFPGDVTFRATDRMVLDPAGPIELIGNGTTIQLEAGLKARVFNCPRLPSGTLIQGFVADMTAQGTRTGVRVGTAGVVELRDITVRGYAPPVSSDVDDAVPAVLMPIARASGGTVRMTNFRATGGTAAGIHDDMGKPASAPENRLDGMIGLWVGQANLGTIQMVGCQLRGWSNGTYSGRTNGQVQILGGTYWNNFNCQARIGGGSLIDGATMLLDGRMWSMKKNPGPYSLGENQGINAVRIETGGNKGTQNEPVTLRNLDIRGISMETSSSLVNIEGSGPSTILENCKVTNHMGVPAILAAAPGSQGGYSAAPITNIMVDYCLFTGSTTEVAVVNERPNSRIQRTCIQIPGAGPESISGMQIGPAVSFGPQCSAGSGLANPKKVGSPGNISSLPAPSYNGSTGTFSRSTPSKKAVGAGAGGMFAAIFGGFVGGLGMLFIMIFVIPAALLFLSLWQILGD